MRAGKHHPYQLFREEAEQNGVACFDVLACLRLNVSSALSKTFCCKKVLGIIHPAELLNSKEAGEMVLCGYLCCWIITISRFEWFLELLS